MFSQRGSNRKRGKAKRQLRRKASHPQGDISMLKEPLTVKYMHVSAGRLGVAGHARVVPRMASRRIRYR